MLVEAEAKQLLSAYGIPVIETRAAHTCDEAVAYAEALGYSVVLTLLSETLTYKG